MHRISHSLLLITLLRAPGAYSQDLDSALIKAADMGQVRTVRALLDKGANVNAELADNHVTPLMAAAHGGHTKIVKILLAKGASINAKDDGGWTALIVAAEGGYPDLVRFLADKGADVNSQYTPMNLNYEETALIWLATWGGRVDVIRALLDKGADVNARGAYPDWTALIAASFAGRTDVVRLLIAKGADVNARDGVQRTALMVANNRDIIKLLKKAGARQ